MIIIIILYVLTAISILFGLYKMFIDDEKGVGYASFIFAILAFLLTLIPTDTESLKNEKVQNTKSIKNEEEQNAVIIENENYTEENFEKENVNTKLNKNTDVIDIQVSGEIIEEIEFETNNTIEEANKIEVNKQYQGNLSSDEDVDYYKFEVENDGKINISFQHDKIDTGDRLWEIYLIDNEVNNEIIRLNSVGGTTIEESNYARIAAGEYYIKINSFYFSDKNYLFQINFLEESDSFEKEQNDRIDSANHIDINRNYIGNLQTDKDVDYYKITVGEKGKVYISFGHDKIDTGDRLWEIYLLDGVDDKTIITLFSMGREALLQSDCVRIPPGDYYLKINSFYYSNRDYNFTVNFESESEQFESEYNNEFSTANNISIDTKYVGNMQSDRDVDYYCLTVNETRNITVWFEHDMIDSNDRYWEIYVINGVNDETVLQMNIRGTENIISATAENVEPGIYYLKVKPYYYNNVDYTIAIE